MEVAGGLLLVAMGLFWSLLLAHWSRGRPWERPRFLHRPGAGRVAGAVRWILLGAGTGLLFATGPRVGLGVVSGLLGLWGWTRWARSAAAVGSALRRRARRIRSERPGLGPEEGLVEAILERHPDWSPETAAQMVKENPDRRRLDRILARMERGWKG